MPRGRRRDLRLIQIVAAACLLGATAPAAAQPAVDDATRAAAATLGEAGIRLYNEGNYAAALEKFEEAERLVEAPTLGLRAARCFVKLHRLIDAADRYAKVIAMPLDASWPEVHRQAQRDARQERDALQARIPVIVVVAEGAGSKQITVDGKPLSDPSGKVLVDPGKHEVALVSGGEHRAQSVELGERETRRVIFHPSAHDGAGSQSSDRRAASQTSAPDQSLQRTLGWIGLGVGAAGVAIGSITGAVAIGKRNDLVDRCPDGRCPPAAWDDNDSYDAFRTASTIGFVVGVAAAAAGVALLVTSARHPAGARSSSNHPLRLVGSF